MRIVIPGDPIAKARHRSFIRHGHVATYDAQDKEKRQMCNLMSKLAENHQLKDCAYKVSFEFNFEPPRSASVATKNLMLWNIIHHTKKPDTSNVMKFYEDCGNGILWKDDCLLIDEHPIKRYAEKACTIIEIMEIKEVKMSTEHEKVFKTFSPRDIDTFEADAERICAAIYDYKVSDKELYELQMNAFAQLLIDFADQWTDKLKKIKGK